MAKTIDEMREAYAWQLAAGTCSASLKCSRPKQVSRYAEAQVANQVLLMRTKPVLIQHGIPAGEHPAYYAFARRLDRLCRRYTDRVLNRAALDLIDLWEARGLDSEILLSLCRKVFAIEDRDPGTEIPETTEAQRIRSQRSGRIRSTTHQVHSCALRRTQHAIAGASGINLLSATSDSLCLRGSISLSEHGGTR